MLSPRLVPDILDSAPDAMIVIDRTGTIIFANRQASTLFGHSQADLIGTSIDRLLPERLRAQHVVHRQRYAEHARVRPMGSGLDLSARRRDGSEIPVEISLSPIDNQGEMLVAAAIRDVTERRQAQNELKRAREAADAANLAKSRFLATASHDLRQPLQTLSLLNGALRRSTEDPTLRDALSQQEQAIDAMAQLLNALLDISKLESGAIKPEVADFKVSKIFQELRGEFVQLATQKGLELQVELCDDQVQSDPALISQVMRNLVSNAIKYTREGRVLLRCMHEPQHVRLEVLDTGIGIPAADIPHIFDEFYQVGVPANASREGYGLGLAIVHRIVQLLGVRLDVQSELGKGSVFSVALPAAAGATHAVAGPVMDTARERSHPTQTVLLVEDDPAVRNATRLLLKVSGYRVLTADSRHEALAQARAHPEIRVLIADYHLAAGETGMQVIAEVRRMLDQPLKAVLMTGDTSSAVLAVAQGDRELRIASKPINANQLLALLDELTSV